MNKEDLPQSLQRYFREVIAHPEGAVVHYGDCNIYSNKVCDCGLLRVLVYLGDPTEWYENFHEEWADHLAALGKITLEQINEQISATQGKSE